MVCTRTCERVNERASVIVCVPVVFASVDSRKTFDIHCSYVCVCTVYVRYLMFGVSR